MPEPESRRAEYGDAMAVGRLIADAFCDLPPARWLIGDREQRRVVFPGYFAIFAEYALTHGAVDIREEAGGDLVAAALWLPITGPPLPPPRDYDARLAAVCGPWLDRFRVFDETLESHHPRASHHHLAFLAVTPTLQGRGLGGRLIAEHHALLDEFGMPAYLEAGDPRSRDLYLRHGYQPLDPFRLPQGPPFFPMWRPPATSRPART